MSLLLNKSVGAVRGTGHSSRRGARIVARAEMPFDASSLVGDKLGRWLKTPFDLLAFGARASAGALVSTPQRLQTLPNDLERIQELLQDPRPISEKQEVLFKEFEDTVVEFLERGADVEADVLANIKTVLPPEAANILGDLIPPAPSKQPMVTVEPMEPSEVVTYQREDVAASQMEAEVTEIKKAVMGLKAALEAIRSNSDPSQINIMRLNLREARDRLSKLLLEVAGTDTSNTSTAVAAAIKEADILVQEVNQAISLGQL